MNPTTKIFNTVQIVITIVIAILLVNVIVRLLSIPLQYSLVASSIITLALLLYLWMVDRRTRRTRT